MCEGMCRHGREQGIFRVSEQTGFRGEETGNTMLNQTFKGFVKSNYIFLGALDE